MSATPKEAEQSEIKTDQAQIAPVLIFLHYFTSRHKRLGHYTTSITYDSQREANNETQNDFFLRYRYRLMSITFRVQT